jgi:hypothetical protein
MTAKSIQGLAFSPFVEPCLAANDKLRQLAGYVIVVIKRHGDVASALLNTQEGSLNKTRSVYAEVNPILLEDKAADKPAIFDAFAAMQRNMAKSDTGNDLAVVMFSGDGAIIDGQLFLLPYGVDAATPARLRGSAILQANSRPS